MLLSPSQLRSLRVEALNWSSDKMCNALGWTGANASTKLVDEEQNRRPIAQSTSNHAVRIARENGYELSQNTWVRTS